LVSCSSTSKFPVSDVLPGANIKAKVKEDDNENTNIEIIANHLANPNRLSPSKSVYVVWGVTDSGMVKNLGKIYQEDTGKVKLEVTTPFEIKEIIITAEDEGNVTSPGNMLITSKKI
jgi:hypothetical protein